MKMRAKSVFFLTMLLESVRIIYIVKVETKANVHLRHTCTEADLTSTSIQLCRTEPVPSTYRPQLKVNTSTQTAALSQDHLEKYIHIPIRSSNQTAEWIRYNYCCTCMTQDYTNTDLPKCLFAVAHKKGNKRTH